MSKQLELIGVESLEVLQLNGIEVIKGKDGTALTVTNTASVGQTIKITAVDDDGQPIELEATDMPSGGGSITSSDDGNGNVTLALSGGISVSDDGAGNVTIT